MFPFLKLPGELRDKICSLVFATKIYPLSTVRRSDEHDDIACAKARLTFGIGYVPKDLGKHIIDYTIDIPRTYVPGASKPVYKPNLALLRVSKQVCAEVLYVAWVLMRKCFYDTHLFVLATKAKAG